VNNKIDIRPKKQQFLCLLCDLFLAFELKENENRGVVICVEEQYSTLQKQ